MPLFLRLFGLYSLKIVVLNPGTFCHEAPNSEFIKYIEQFPVIIMWDYKVDSMKVVDTGILVHKKKK